MDLPRIRSVKLVTSFPIMMKCSSVFDDTCYYIPWEFPTACISSCQFYQQFGNASDFWYLST